MEEKHFLEDIQLAYAEAIDRMTSEWVHDDDGANNHEQTGTRKVLNINNNVLLIYQPIGKDECWYDDAMIIITPTKECKFKITEEIFNKVLPMLQVPENKFIESYNQFVSDFGRWITDFSGKTFKSLLGIDKEIHYDSGKLKIKYDIGNYIDGIYRWSGKILREWIYSLPAYERLRMKDFEELTKFHEENIKHLDQEIKIMEEELPTIPNQLHYISVESNLKNYKEVKEERIQMYLKKKEQLKKPQKYGSYEGTAGEWQTKEYYKEKYDGREEEIAEALKNPKSFPLTLEEAFPNRPKPKLILKIKIPKGLAGSKRGRE
jgi:hypothetical protein